MLDQIVRQMQAFAREYGRQPNVLYINPEDYIALSHQCPGWLVQGDGGVVMGELHLKVVLVPQECLTEPRVACVMPGLSRIHRPPAADMATRGGHQARGALA